MVGIETAFGFIIGVILGFIIMLIFGWFNRSKNEPVKDFYDMINSGGD